MSFQLPISIDNLYPIKYLNYSRQAIVQFYNNKNLPNTCMHTIQQ